MRSLVLLVIPGVMLPAPGRAGTRPVEQRAAAGPAQPAAQAAVRKLCPKCGRRYPLALNFCEQDGSRLLAPPPAVTELAAVATAPGRLALSWKDNSGSAARFVVQRRGPNSPFQVVGNTRGNETSYTDSGLPVDTRYTYRVQAVNAVGASPFCAEVSAVTLPAPPAPPGGLAANTPAQRRVQLTWKDNSANEEAFEIERASAGGPFQRIATTPRDTTTLQDAGLEENRVYLYRVRATNAGGASDYSVEVRVATAPDGPAAPRDLCATPVSRSQVRLDWTDDATDEERFLVERASASVGWALVATLETDVTTYVDCGLSANVTYQYRVRAANIRGFSSFSNEAQAATPRYGPTFVKAEPTDPSAWLRAVPNRATVQPGQKLPVEYTFRYGAYPVQLLARWTTVTSPAGKVLARGTGPVEMKGALPELGRHTLRDQVTAAAYVVAKARAEGQDSLVLRQYFEGRRPDGSHVVWSTAITLAVGPEAPPASGEAKPPAPKPAAPAPRQNERDAAEMVYVAAGGFRMGQDEGAPDEKPCTPVQLARGFWIYRTEVTNAQYRKFVEATGHREPSFWSDTRFNAPDQPVVGVSWEDAVAYAKWAGGRLPTEAEWEFVARGREERPYAWGRQALTPARAIYKSSRPGACGQAKDGATPNGILDLCGNVAEWCADWYAPDAYVTAAAREPQGPAQGTARVVRGGSWKDAEAALHAAVRAKLAPDTRSETVGFRVVVAAAP